jgi:hypothetical protein
MDKNSFFSPVGPNILNSSIILTSCGSQIDHQKFNLSLVQNFLEMSAKELWPRSRQRGRLNPQAKQITHIESQHSRHWPAARSHLWCHVSSVKKKRMATKFQCSKCKASLCIDLCFSIFHIKVNFYNNLLLWRGKNIIYSNISNLHFDSYILYLI